MPEFTALGKPFKAHPTLIPDARDLAPLHPSTCQISQSDQKGERGGPLPLIEALEEITLPPEVAERREGESLYDHTLRTLPHVLSALEEKYGPLPERTHEKDLEFLNEMLEWWKG